jgi:hypothetical protein
MATTAKHRMADVMTMWTATFLEVPAATTQWSWGISQQHEMEAAVWKGYDAWVRTAKAAVDRMYGNSLFGEFAVATLDRALRWQQWQQAIASTVAASVVPLTGLPTAAAVDAVHEEVQLLRSHLTEQNAQLRALREEIQTKSVDRIPVQDPSRFDRAFDRHTQTTPAPRNGRHVVAVP